MKELEQLNGLGWGTGDLVYFLKRTEKGSQPVPKGHFALPMKNPNFKVSVFISWVRPYSAGLTTV